MFKWLCLLVAATALAVFGWMFNDIRLDIKGLVERTDKQLPRILTQTEQVTAQLDRHLPKLLDQSEKAATTINSHMPRLLTQTEQAATTINSHLPRLLANTETAVDNIGELSDSFKQYKGLMGVVHAATQNKELFSYGSGLLSWLGGHDATIGVKSATPGEGLKQAKPAKEWVNSARKDVHFLSLISTSKADLLRGLARSNSSGPLHIQIGKEVPRLLADWVKDMHPDSKDLK